MKYCNQCGAQLATKDESVSATEQRFDDYLEGLFWVAALGLGMVLGGMIVIKTVLEMSETVMVGYGALSAAAFVTVFVVSLWKTIQLGRIKRSGEDIEVTDLDTNKLAGSAAKASLPESASIIEDTTRTLDKVPIHNDRDSG